MPKLFNHALGDGAVGSGTLNGEGASKTQAERVVHAKFVALGVSAEVVVIIENEDARFVAGRLAVEMRGRQSADAAADDDQVVGFAGIFGLARRIPESSIAKAVRGFERSGMAAAHAGQSGWIVVRETSQDRQV